ncbi:unnamed protein product, partial [marine sediment metagenome]
GSIGFGYNDDETGWATASASGIELDTLYCIVATYHEYDETHAILKIYVNGIFKGDQIKLHLPNKTAGFYIGSAPGRRHFPGLIDEVRFYKRELTVTEAKELSDSPRKGFRLVAGKTYTYEHAFTDRAIVDFEKVFENGEEYTEKTSIDNGGVEATASSFYFDTATKILYVHTSTGADPIGFYAEGRFILH